jgi:hypothetical protein
MTKLDIQSISTYFLLLELLNNGDTGLIVISTQLSEYLIFEELKRRSGVDYGTSKKDWADWFIRGGDGSSKQERSHLLEFLKLKETTKKILDRSDKNKQK